MNILTLSKPVKEKGSDGQWIVYIVGANDLCTGVSGRGSTVQEATKDAQAKIDTGKKGVKELELDEG